MDSISQHSLHDELLARLRRMIIDGELRPGDKVPERQLCDHFGVSRTPLREALKVLAAEGFIELAPNRGAMIAASSTGDIEEVLPISAAIEALSGELACEHITDEEIARIKAIHVEMAADFEAGRFQSYAEKNRLIHQHIVAAARNPLLASLYDTLFFRIGRGRCAEELASDMLHQDLAYHQEIIKALEERQGVRLAGLLKSHLEACFSAYSRDNA
jgi:DNA-binding GntR family transcriptional regulator